MNTGRLFYIKKSANSEDYDQTIAKSGITLREAKKMVKKTRAIINSHNFKHFDKINDGGVWLFQEEGQGFQAL